MRSLVNKLSVGAAGLFLSGVAMAEPILTTVDLSDAEADIGTAAVAIVGLMIIVMGARIVIGFFRK